MSLPRFWLGPVRAKTTTAAASRPNDSDFTPCSTQSPPPRTAGRRGIPASAPPGGGGGGPRPPGVGPCVRLGQADPDDLLAAADPRHPPPGDLGSGVGGQ